MIFRAMNEAEVSQSTCKLGTFFNLPLTLTGPIFNNFQENGFSVELSNFDKTKVVY